MPVDFELYDPDDERLASYGAILHGLAAVEDRFDEGDFDGWQDTAVDPRTVESDDNGF
jgi:hypothetical protein